MARRKRRSSSRRSKKSEYPGWLWMLFGLAIGLSVAFAVYVKDREPEAVAEIKQQDPASMQDSMDAEPAKVADEPEVPEDRFDFYKMLPAFEIVIDDDEPEVDQDVAPQAVEEPGVYLLQAGSFSKHDDADRRRAELALHGVESRVQRARVNGRDYYRVYVGPIEDLGELNMTRSRLRAAKIDVMRIRLGE